MNTTPLLSHIEYEMCHYDCPEVAFRRIDDAQRDGKKIVLPCAEQKDLESILEHIRAKFPHKTTLRIDGTIHGDHRDDAMKQARETVFDVLGYTASVDSGISIDIIGYDLVFCRAELRSVSATALMQMMQRVRHMNDNKIVVLCESRAKDWENYPGYQSEQLAPDAEVPRPMVNGDTLRDAMKNLLDLTAPVAYFASGRRRWRLTRQLPPRKATMDEAHMSLIAPVAAHKIACDGPDIKTTSQYMDRMDMILTKAIVENDIPQYRGLVKLMTRDRMAELNRARDIVASITDIGLKQGATVTNTFTCFDDDDTPVTDDIKHLRAGIAMARAQLIMHAPTLAMPALRKIHRHQTPTDEEECALSLAYARATFGVDAMKYMDVTDYTDMRLQEKYRLMCRMTDLMMTIPEQVHDRLTRECETTKLVGTKSDSMIQLILYDMLRAYGFNGPFDKKEIPMSEGDLAEVADKLRPLCSKLNKLNSGRGGRDPKPIPSSECSPCRTLEAHSITRETRVHLQDQKLWLRLARPLVGGTQKVRILYPVPYRTIGSMSAMLREYVLDVSAPRIVGGEV